MEGGGERIGLLSRGETHVGRIYIALDDIKDGDIAGGFTRRRGDHTIFRLEKTPHNVKNRCFADGLGL